MAFGLCAALLAGRCAALDLHAVDATYAGGVFRVRLEAVLHAPPAAVEAVLMDYTRYNSLDPRIKSAQLLSREADGALLVRTVIDACAGLFCRKVERVERVERRPGLLIATVIRSRSDVRRGVARTEWRAQAGGTLVVYEAEFEPDFWVPSLIGRLYGARALRESILKLFGNVEQAARAR